MERETFEERLCREREEFNGLIGRTVQRLLVAEGEETLVFDTVEGPIAFETYGDCCSETWFADVCGFDALIGSPVLSVEKTDLPAPEDERTRQECDEAYGVKITTAKGVCDIAYRNSSNGWYGGDAYRSRVVPDLSGFREITSDWQA